MVNFLLLEILALVILSIPFFFFFFFITSLIGAFLGFTGERVRELIVASSLLQTGILGILANTNCFAFKIYFIVYALIR